MPVPDLLFMMFHLLKFLRTLAPLPLVNAHQPSLSPPPMAATDSSTTTPTNSTDSAATLNTSNIALAVFVDGYWFPLLLKVMAGLWWALGSGFEDLESQHHISVCHLIRLDSWNSKAISANYCSVRSLLGKRPCTSFQGVNVAETIETYGNYIAGKHPWGPKLRCTSKHPLMFSPM